MKLIKYLLILTLVMSTQHIHAYTNKTFLRPRNQGLVNLPLEMTTFQERISAKYENRWGIHVQAVGYGGASTNKSTIGSYFGINNANNINLLRSEDSLSINGTDRTFDVGYIIHDSAAAPTSAQLLPVTTLSFNPKSTHGGVCLIYYQDLSPYVEGLYVKAKLPIEHVANDVGLMVKGGDVNPAGPGHLATKANIYNFFQGKVITGQTAIDLQQPLTAGKVNGKRSATGVADIDLMVGYNFLKKETHHLGFNIGFSIPTGNTAKGEYLFEPVYGTKNFGLGFGLEGSARVWAYAQHNVKINCAANYRYLFQGSEQRIPGLDNDNFGQYELIAQKNLATTDPIKLQPAANLLNKKAHVTLGSQFEGMLGFAYNYRDFTFNLGYNLYCRQGEVVHKKGNLLGSDTYGTASKGLIANTGAANAVGNIPAYTPGVDVTFGTSSKQFDFYAQATTPPWLSDKNDLNTGAATTPTQLTNSIYAGAGYAFSKWKYPLMLGLGWKYEFASKNSALSLWQLDIKVGASF